MISRREFLKVSFAMGGGLYLSTSKLGRLQRVFAQIPGGSLDPDSIDKFVLPLVKPPSLKRDGKINYQGMKNAEYYKIAVREFQQQILPPGLPQTTIWCYGPEDDFRTVAQGGAYFYPAFTMENKWQQPTVVKWVNGLGGKQHLLPVDPSLHWANPIGRRDTRPNPVDDPYYWDHQYIGSDGRYTGPVPIVTHVHGAHTTEESDGYPEAWFLPAGATDVESNRGRFFDYYYSKYSGLDWGPGYATFTYPNDQRATSLWYHDHTLGMTRLNVYAGPAGFWLIRGGPDDMVIDTRNGRPATLPGPPPGTWPADPFGTYYEIPIVVQDRSFNENGSLFYPDNRAFFEGLEYSQLKIPFTYDQWGIHPDPNGWGLGCDDLVSDVAPIWQPEFFGNTMVVNGQTWPFLDVEQRRYRFRMLNGCNSRFLILQFADPRVDVWQIGADGGFLPAPVRLTDYPYPGSSGGATLLMAPAERADIIIDFTNVPVGTEVLMLNLGPDEPFGGGEIGPDFDPSDPGSTGQVMQFRVGPALSLDKSTPPERLQLPAIAPVEPTSTRTVSLNEEESKNILVVEEDGSIVYSCESEEPFGPTAALLGTYDPDSGLPTPELWMDPITENPTLGSSETWEIYNFTADAHPIHVHLVQFQVVDRQSLSPIDEEGVATQPAQPIGTPRPPEAWETGFKDTVIAYPGEVTRVKMKFDYEGFYVWHCHIVEHEDNEMMRPYHVGDIPGDAPAG